MIKFLKIPFEKLFNQNINTEGIDELLIFIKEKIITAGWIQFNGHESDEIIHYNIFIQGKELFFGLEHDYTLPIKKLKKFTKDFVDRYKSIIIMFSNATDEKINDERICELWGFRIFLLNKRLILEPIKLKELYLCSTFDEIKNKSISPHRSTIYCGPEGKKNGWDHMVEINSKNIN